MTTALVFFAIGLSALVQVFTDPRITKAFVWKSLLAIAVYALHGSVGVGVLFLLWSDYRGSNAALGAITAWMGWLGLGFLGLVRFAPATRQPPRFLMHFGIPDAMCFALIVGGLVVALGYVEVLQ